MDTDKTTEQPVKNFRQRVVLTNLRALIASSRTMNAREKSRYYTRYQKKYPATSSARIFFLAIGKKLAYAAVVALVTGVSVLMYTTLSREPAGIQIDTTVLTENGQRTKIELPDGTEVWLNYGSKLSYNNNYSLSNREVILSGEAYFNVKKNASLAFRVITENLQVKVLGTQFNVKAYPGETTERVSLNEGSLEVADLTMEKISQLIKPGEMASYNKQKQQFNITSFNVAKLSAWKEGYIYFEKEPLEKVFAELQRKYDIDIVVADRTVLNSVVTATIKDDYYADVIKSIAYSCKLNYSISNKNSMNDRIKIIISR
jgi:transmembrane sensor